MKLRKFTAPVLASVILAAAAMSGCGNGIDKNAVVATLDDQEITLGFANFMARYQQASYDSYYIGWMGEDMWSKDIYGNGSTFEEDVKTEIINNIEDLYVLANHMEDYNVEITEEDTAAMEKAADEFLANNSKKAISQVGAEKDYIVEMLRLQTIQDRMYEAIIADVDTDVPDEEAAQRTFSYVQVERATASQQGTADGETEGESSTADGETEGESSDNNATAQQALSIMEEVQQATEVKVFADEAATDFESAAEDAGYTVRTASYGSAEDTDSSFPEEVLKAADSLKEGEISGLIQTDSNYYVIRLDSEFDEDATESKRQSIISERRSEKYTDVLDEYKNDVKWEVKEDVWKKVKFDELFTMTEETEDDGTGSGETENTGGDGTENTGGSETESADGSISDTE